jgi:hypothetical protein
MITSSSYNQDLISEVTSTLGKKRIGKNELNEMFERRTKIVEFFRSERDIIEFSEFLKNPQNGNGRNKSLGDFQTPRALTDRICAYLKDNGLRPKALVEPTCGEGNFVISAIQTFPELEYVYAVDTQTHYEWRFKMNLLKLSHESLLFQKKFSGVIEFHCDNIFTHLFSQRFSSFLDSNRDRVLILGNPPWATNSSLSAFDSNNLPVKSNLKKLSGFDALTGKSNFDISEYIILRMIELFSKITTSDQSKDESLRPLIAMLCKTSVIRNIIRDSPSLGFKLGSFRELRIDAKKEFDISADSALFLTRVDPIKKREYYCEVSSLYEPNRIFKKYGWFSGQFVSDIDLYKEFSYLDGKSVFEWRQGIKHDAVKVMILDQNPDGSLVNGLSEQVEIEDELLYPFFKGSDLREPILKESEAKIIVTIKTIREDTAYIEKKFPKAWRYLNEYSKELDNRKSKIYSNMPRFSIFGIGDYSFKPFKVAICSMYREPKFALLMPVKNKPAMVDDISYFVSFDSPTDAIFSWLLLKSDNARNFLSSIVFEDSKRLFTKDVLMRISFSQLAQSKSFSELKELSQEKIDEFGELKIRLTENEYLNYRESLTVQEEKTAANTMTKFI